MTVSNRISAAAPSE